MTRTVSKFDLLGALPTGTTVLEASAGTGKTYAIVGLATRFVAEGAAELSQLLLVTFSRAATQELRERTRDRFAGVARALADPEAARHHPDELIRHLAGGDVATHRRRLLRALSDFDAATIATTHGFCQRMLDELGTAGERDTDAVLVEDVDDLTIEVIADLYLRRYGRADRAPISHAEAAEAARAAVFDPQAALAPEGADGTPAGERVEFARAVRAEVDRRKRLAGLRDYDDQLALLHAVLTDPEHGEAACRRIGSRFRVVLVDEFQDTDPLQWEILRSAFHRRTTLVLVGDPKQAIYAFRGAEVLSYLGAMEFADGHQELVCNWRSDGNLLAALDHLYGGAALGDPRIVAHPVEAAQPASRIAGAAPLRLRHLPRTGAGPCGASGFPKAQALQERVARDVAADVAALLGGDVTVDLGAGRRPVEPGDVAVLVRTNAQVALVHGALTGAGIPAVLAGGTSVFATPAAREWLRVLQALEQPHRPDRVRLAALTSLMGRTAEDVDTRGDELVAAIGTLLRELDVVFERSGFAALFERLAAFCDLEPRLLGWPGGERELTDLRHLAQLLDETASAEALGVTALTRWLTERIAEAGTARADRSRRLDSDAAAVQVLTVHASKGLEFPVVYVPFAWESGVRSKPDRLLLHDDDGRRVLDVGGEGSAGYGERRRRHDEEVAGEELRLLYVALTRARCHLVLWWAPGYSTSGAPLHRMLFGRVPGTSEIAHKARVPEDPIVAQQLTGWAGRAAGTASVEAVGSAPIPAVTWVRPHETVVELEAARFDRELDDAWRRTSYTALTAAAHEGPGAGAEAEQPAKTDEPEEPPLLPADAADDGIASPMNPLPGGAVFGTLVHAVLEVVDTAAADLGAELLRCCRDTVAEQFSDVDPEELAEALLPVLRTPLAGGAGTLADIAPADRLAELDFELPLAGGDDPVATTVTLDGVARLLRAHLPAGDPFASYADLVGILEPTPLRGYLTGSIDSVLRIHGTEPRFVIVDYKTNRLGPEELTTAHYTRDRMAEEMLRAHYPMQALLYAVALHRYLRWRLPGYDPAVHLGGVQYLFVRGMVGPDTPAGCGVFDWAPPPALVAELSDLLAGKEVP
ncbi:MULTISPECIES: UvrD-helicase domain-containing protein [Rhodococcus]|uniref:UvrD-helicase domain-containing protein n=1 Tax=Rhodococcus TaxID=1827 RepID=UPI00045CE920|nr:MULTISPECIES: UvrD-helicase domain-containing protein [Rhodococcus]NCL75839.1 RecBCD enzyme subunit RecB [Rhodococcus sp. YH1]KDE14133.1 ATPase AAA [Rhodococcus aetherivorans]QRI75339.1 UvrD-helicase domain-containing protein [Rhodococcus aetherivorans]QSE58749.1 UvrD-helicase domain-containing protein [Rhodococcus sp. PSBB066]QSE69929.1 UvrD-helicase domain-containing protein [Rhodococcus sp. PSBB049]